MNLPNKLTVIRILLVPVMVTIPFLGLKAEILGITLDFWIMNLIFIIASITDKLDGTIARKRNLVTNFGKFLDPIADKILVLSAMLILVEKQMIPAWIPIIVLTREFVVSAYRLIAVEQGGKVISASNWGKLKTVTQIIAIVLAFININGNNIFLNFIHWELTGIELIINILTSLMLIISVVATIFSGYNYIKGGKDLFKDR
ncbi:MAG: CDP-diacylglycerol--glycerol-3-phosphate 3-phosphatidyltransferase [Clostridia bacterium]|jgi:CDP-diacylglycerol--glycerol-3-phosphate 3-phosphatidyltransferase|nr:CDP-diacylglycerol--glycerol-3-phosphate 3-phosphatidyltransferase [Clostridia bacterium]